MTTRYRFFEMIPGLLAWTTIILMIVLSWLAPVFVAIFIILFDVYWLLKTVYLVLHLRSTFIEIRKNFKINWIKKLENILSDSEAKTWIIEKPETRNADKPKINNWEELYHLIIFPMYKEPYELVKETFENLVKVNYPKDKIIIALGTEEKAGKSGKEIARKIEKEFGNQFFKFIITDHPQNLPGEIPGKGSNQTWIAKSVKKQIIDPLKIPYENIIASVFDVDTYIYPDYFARLTYVFLTCEKPLKTSLQPVPLFANNIFQAPAMGRVIAFSSTFWQMVQQSRQERLTTFSSHSMPFKAIVDIGFWEKNVVSEDSRIFWQCYFHYKGDWRVVPLFYLVSMDANIAPTFWGTMTNLYKQQRRWGWGSENIPYILEGFLKNPSIRLRTKLRWSFVVIESFHSWATNALMIFALGWLPIILGSAAFNFSLLSYNLPQITRFLMMLATIGIISSATLSVMILPPKPKWFRFWHYFLYFFQWALMPITLIIFGAFPGLEAQTRLMMGGRWRLGFWPTPKHR